jgi:DNA-binding SARP family transcriptional activator/tetratricopeptide (TPR) repeat protein
MLGPLEVNLDGRPLTLTTGRLRTVLATLAISAGRVVTVDRLATAIWADEQLPANPHAAVRLYVARLRGLLGAEAITSSQSGYTLNLAGDRVDVHRFTRLLASAAAAADPADEYEQLTAALALWRGTPFEGVDSAWLGRSQAPQLVERYLTAVERRIDLDLAAGRIDGLVAELRELTDRHPLRESLWVRLLTVLDQSGRQAEALEQYETIRVRLAEELGTDPGPALQQLHHDLLTGQTQPRRPSSPADRATPPRQLPSDIDGFVGRDALLKQLSNLVREVDRPGGAVVISAIGGAAGVGKTALAVHFAYQVAPQYPDGQLFVNLRGFAPTPPMNPAEAVRGFLDALGVPRDRIPAQPDAQVGLYRSLLVGKRMLVILDNAHDAEQVRPLLPGSPGCLVLVTSRHRLTGLVARDGAARLDLDALTPQEAHGLLARMLGAERVAADQAATTELAELCGHLPLALRIAAANLITHPHTTIDDYVDQLREDRLAALEIAGDPMGGVRAAFDRSYASLSDPGRRLFRLLGLIPGPDFTVDAVTALAGGAPAGLLDELAAAHLVDEYAHRRYRMHDLVRDYAAERASEADDSDAVLHRLYEFYLRSVDAAARHLYPQTLRLPLPAALAPGPVATIDDHRTALSWLDAERANLVAAVTGTPARTRSVAWRLADALRGYLMLHRHLPEWGEVARAGLAAAEADGDAHGMAAARLSLAGRARATVDQARAVEEFTAALTMSRRAGWDEGEAAALSYLGVVNWTSGRISEAAEQFAAALTVDERTGRLSSWTIHLGSLGSTSVVLGRLAAGAQQLREALETIRRVGAPGIEAAALASLGEAYHYQGRFEEAGDLLARAVTMHRELGDHPGEAIALRLRAALLRDLGQPASALELAEAAVALAREARDAHGEAYALVTEASIRGDVDQPAAAVAGCQRALALARHNGYLLVEATALTGLATAELHAGQPDQAAGHAIAALTGARLRQYRLLEGDALTALATIELHRGRPAEAIDHADQALAIHTGTGYRLGEARTHLVAAAALHASGRPDDADEPRASAEAIFAETGDHRPVPNAR